MDVLSVYSKLQDTMSTIETNKPTRQKTTFDNDYVAPAKVMRAVVTNSRQERKSGKLSAMTARASHCLPTFFRKLSSLPMNWGIYFVFIPGITIPGITFLIPRLNNSILSRVNYPWYSRFIPGLALSQE